MPHPPGYMPALRALMDRKSSPAMIAAALAVMAAINATLADAMMAARKETP